MSIDDSLSTKWSNVNNMTCLRAQVGKIHQPKTNILTVALHNQSNNQQTGLQ